MRKASNACWVLSVLTLLLSVVVGCNKNFGSPVTPLASVPTATPTGVFTPGPTATSTPSNAIMWDDFDETPWTGWTSSGAYSYLANATAQNGSVPTVSVSTSASAKEGAATLLVDTVMSTSTGNLLEVTLQNNLATNAQTTSSNPTYLSLWVNSLHTNITVTRVGIGLGSTPTYYYATVNQTMTYNQIGIWVNVLVPISAFNTPGPVPAMTNLDDVLIDMTNPSASSLDVLIDSIAFYP